MSGQQKYEKVYEVFRANPRKEPIVIDGKELKPARSPSGKVLKGTAYVKDKGLADRINAEYGPKGQDMVRVVEVDNWKTDSTGTHRYTFRATGTPRCPVCNKRMPRQEYQPYCSKECSNAVLTTE